MKILFMGSPSVAVPSLQALLESGHSVIGVVSPPDRAAGRGREITPPPIALLAKEKGLPLLQPESVKNNPGFLSELQDMAPDLIVVVAYGYLLPPEIVSRWKCVNVHFSLLPKYRGAAPLQWALINGDEETGVTTMLLVDKLDAGPILLQKKVQIHDEDDAEILGKRLSITGAQLLIETIEGLASETIVPFPQEDKLVSLAPPLKKEDGRLDWSRKSQALACQVRGMNPWPGAFTFLQGKRLKICRAEPGPEKKGSPGEILQADLKAEGIHVACGRGTLILKEVQMEGAKKLDAASFLKGHPLTVGEKLERGIEVDVDSDE